MPRVLSRQGDVRKEAEDIYASLLANEADLSHLKLSVDTLGELIRLVQGLTTQHDSLRATKRSTAKELDAALNQVRKLVTFLQVCLRRHYGEQSEKLLEFQIQPLRPRTGEGKRRPKPRAPEPPETPATPETRPQVRPDTKAEPES